MWLYCKFQHLQFLCFVKYILIFLIYLFQFKISYKFVFNLICRNLILINNVNILSEKATNALLGFLNVASQAFFDNILGLWIRILGTTSECFLHIAITCFLMQISGSFFENHVYNELRIDALKIVLKNV